MNDVIREIYQRKTILDADGNSRDIFPISVKEEEGEVLYRLVRDHNVTYSLETGMALGLSALHICQALKENDGIRHTSIDPWQEKWFKNIGVHNLQRARLDGLQQMLCCPSHEGLASLIAEGRPHDFALIDGNHRFEYVLTDFFLADKILRKGAILVLHDTWMPSIRKVVTFILRNLSGHYELLPDSVAGYPPIWHRLYKATRMILGDWRDIGPALVFGRQGFSNLCIFKKTHEIEPESVDGAWDFYRSF